MARGSCSATMRKTGALQARRYQLGAHGVAQPRVAGQRRQQSRRGMVLFRVRADAVLSGAQRVEKIEYGQCGFACQPCATSRGMMMVRTMSESMMRRVAGRCGGAPSTGPIRSTVPRVCGSTVPRVHGFRAWKGPSPGRGWRRAWGFTAVRGTGFGKLYAPFRHVKSMEGVPAVIGRRGRNASRSLARVHGRVAAGTLCVVALAEHEQGSRPRAAPPERRRQG